MIYELMQIVDTIAPELLLTAAALIGVLIGAVIGEDFNKISFKGEARGYAAPFPCHSRLSNATPFRWPNLGIFRF